MRFFKLTLVMLFAISILSCEKEVMLNSEAEIISMSLPEGILTEDPLIKGESITAVAHRGVDLSSLVPVFEVSTGATMDYQEGSALDFTKPVQVTVISEDQKNTKTYTITVSVLSNSEANILNMTLPEGTLKEDIVISDEQITGIVNRGIQLKGLVPEFTLSEGAVMDFQAGTAVDFTEPLQVTVTSEDQKTVKTYTIILTLFTESTRYEFETVKYPRQEGTEEELYLPYQDIYDGDFKWGNPNAGLYLVLAIAGQTEFKAEDFVTYQIPDGKNGNGVAMVTRSTGSMGAMFGARIAAGSLFNGIFELNIADQAKSAQFGTPYTQIPLSVDGYFKYQAGAENMDAAGNLLDYKDRFDIYAVMFETTDEFKYLDGTNSLTHESIVMTARIDEKDCIETQEWTRFSIAFETLEGKSIDAQKLEAGKYSLALVFTSSVNGGIYEGAVDSTLYLDSVEVVY